MNITKGKWITKEGQIYPQETGKTLALIPYYDNTNEEQEANAQLIAEAGTVCNKLNLTPKQLADQRAELLEFVKEMRSRYANSPWIASQCDELITKATNK